MNEEIKQTPNYYAVIPATVRYDKELSPNAKLLYCEITSLCNDKGYCWATNAYFCELYGISDRQVQRILKQLCEKHYIKIIIEKKTKRKIFILDTPDKNVGIGATKMSYPCDKNVVHNNKKNNKSEYKEEKRNNKEKVEIFDYDWLG